MAITASGSKRETRIEQKQTKETKKKLKRRRLEMLFLRLLLFKLFQCLNGSFLFSEFLPQLKRRAAGARFVRNAKNLSPN